MGKEINLLPRKNVGLLQQEQTIIIARAIAMLSVLIVVCSFVGVFLLGRNYSVSDVEAQQASVRARLSLLNAKITQELTVVDRINHIQKVLQTRSLLTDKITILQKQLPPDVTLQTLEITPQDVSLSVSSPSLASLKIFLDKLTSMVSKKTLLKKLTIADVIVDAKTGNYTVNVDAIFL